MTYKLSEELIVARTCYRHLAGALGIAVCDALQSKCILAAADDGSKATFEITDFGRVWSMNYGFYSPSQLTVKSCMDYSHKRPHISGRWAVAFLDFLIKSEYLCSGSIPRHVYVTESGKQFFHDVLDMNWDIILSSRDTCNHRT